MIPSKLIFLIFIGLVAGIITSAGIFAFVTLIGVITRLATRTNTGGKIPVYEDIVVVGVTVGNIVSLFDVNLFFGVIGFLVYGFFSGCYIGCLAVALEEVSQVFPIISNRMKLKAGIPILILILALGKLVGSLYYLVLS